MSSQYNFEAVVRGRGSLADIDLNIASIPTATLRHSAVSNIDIEAVVDDSIRQYEDINATTELYVREYDADTGADLGRDRIYRGELREVETQGSGSTATLKTFGRLIKLEQTESLQEYSDIEAYRALRQYISNQTPFAATVKDDPGQTVVDNGLAFEASTQSEFDSVLSGNIPSDVPFGYQNGRLEPLPTGYVVEAENASPAQTISDPKYSGGSAAQDLGGNASAVVSATVTTEYDMTANEWEVAIRHDKASNNDIGNVYDVFVDGTAVGLDGPANLLSWEHRSADFDLPAGNHLVEIVITQNLDDQAIFDLFGIFDTNYSYNFDNTNLSTVSRNHLNGPETFPNTAAFVWPLVDRNTQVTAARINSNWNNTTGPQQLAASPNGGEDYITASNTESVEADFEANNLIGSDLQIKTTHGRISPNGARTQTPRFGYAGQAIESIELRFDQSSVAIIGPSGVQLTESDLDNIKTLADIARYDFVVDHPSPTDSITAFPKGSETRSATWITDDWSRTDGDRNYANRVVVRGAEKPEAERDGPDDLRYEGIARDGDEIQRLENLGLSTDEAEQTNVTTDPKIESDNEAVGQAFAALEEAVESRLPTGSVSIAPTFIAPGYSYPVEEFSGPNDDSTPTPKLQSLRLREEYGSASATLEFETPKNWVRGSSPLRADVATIKRLF